MLQTMYVDCFVAFICFLFMIFFCVNLFFYIWLYRFLCICLWFFKIQITDFSFFFSAKFWAFWNYFFRSHRWSLTQWWYNDWNRWILNSKWLSTAMKFAVAAMNWRSLNILDFTVIPLHRLGIRTFNFRFRFDGVYCCYCLQLLVSLSVQISHTKLICSIVYSLSIVAKLTNYWKKKKQKEQLLWKIKTKPHLGWKEKKQQKLYFQLSIFWFVYQNENNIHNSIQTNALLSIANNSA